MIKVYVPLQSTRCMAGGLSPTSLVVLAGKCEFEYTHLGLVDVCYFGFMTAFK